jgi:hypothetical protein
VGAHHDRIDLDRVDGGICRIAGDGEPGGLRLDLAGEQSEQHEPPSHVEKSPPAMNFRF